MLTQDPSGTPELVLISLRSCLSLQSGLFPTTVELKGAATPLLCPPEHWTRKQALNTQLNPLRRQTTAESLGQDGFTWSTGKGKPLCHE